MINVRKIFSERPSRHSRSNGRGIRRHQEIAGLATTLGESGIVMSSCVSLCIQTCPLAPFNFLFR